MMTDLLEVYWTTVYVPLVGLPEDWIERFLHVNRKSIFCHHHYNGIFHPFKRVLG